MLKKVEASLFIQQHRKQCPVAVMHRKLGVTRAGYYAWVKRGKSRRHVDNTELLGKIIEVHQASQALRLSETASRLATERRRRPYADGRDDLPLVSRMRICL